MELVSFDFFLNSLGSNMAYHEQKTFSAFYNLLTGTAGGIQATLQRPVRSSGYLRTIPESSPNK